MPDEGNLDVLIRTGISDPVYIQLVQGLLEEAGIPYFTADENINARQESGNFFGWWSLRVPHEYEAATREILADVESAKPIEEPSTEASGTSNP
jgi:hypothetical protein